MEWLLLDKDYSFSDEIRTSGYADMLNDNDRNNKYYYSLMSVIKQMKKKNVPVHVLDIGCGSGLLSMMALKLGADKVTACESFEPMFKCAQNILLKNNLLSDRIDLFNCHSSDLKVGLNMKEKANILVSEIFDTELIGEGVLSTFDYALKNLLTPNPIVIPSEACYYLQIIDSDFLNNHSWLKENKHIRKLPYSYGNCFGYCSVFDIQASSLINYQSKLIGEPIKIKELTFSQIDNSYPDKLSFSLPYSNDKRNYSFIVWWELKMTSENSEFISTAPKWIDKTDDYHWRDHWLQAVFCVKNCNKNKNFDFQFSHDKFSIWIEMDNNSNNNINRIERKFCSCGLHSHIPRNRLYQLNSSEYSKQIDFITEYLQLKSIENAVVISDLSYLTISLSNAGLFTQTIIDSEHVRNLTEEIVRLNTGNNYDKTMFSSLEKFSPINNCDYNDDGDYEIGIVGDPYFIHSIYPWENIHFWLAAESIRKHHFPHINCVISPEKMIIKAILVKFSDLYKITKRVESIQGFDMSRFDELINRNEENIDNLQFESRFLWEYECYAKSEINDLITIDMTESIESMLDENVLELEGVCSLKSIDFSEINGLVLWTAWELAENVFVDTSLQSIDFTSGKIIWKPFVKQAVHILNGFHNENLNEIELKVKFNLESCDFNFSIAT